MGRPRDSAQRLDQHRPHLDCRARLDWRASVVTFLRLRLEPTFCWGSRGESWPTARSSGIAFLRHHPAIGRTSLDQLHQAAEMGIAVRRLLHLARPVRQHDKGLYSHNLLKKLAGRDSPWAEVDRKSTRLNSS